VEIRFDPLDPEWLLVFKDGKYLATAEPVAYSSMKDTGLAAQKIEEKRRRRKGFILEYRQMTSVVPDVLEYSKTSEIERAVAAIKTAERKQMAERAEITRERTPEELAAEVSRIEDFKPSKRPIFNSEVDRYQWCLNQMTGLRQGFGAAGNGQMTDHDMEFVRDYEARMDEDTKEYWEIYKGSLSGAQANLAN